MDANGVTSSCKSVSHGPYHSLPACWVVQHNPEVGERRSAAVGKGALPYSCLWS